MRAGLFGGTFNPLHNGHIRTITFIRNKFALDTVYFIPAATPPHKSDKELASTKDRREMVAESIAAIPGLAISDIEIQRAGPSYTIDTVRAFKTTCREKRLFLIMGSDVFFDITTWERFDEIFDEIPVIVMLRADDKKGLDEIGAFIHEGISKGYKMTPEQNAFDHPHKKRIVVSEVPEIDISSTYVRHLVKRGGALKGLVPPPVEEMIAKRGLYV